MNSNMRIELSRSTMLISSIVALMAISFLVGIVALSAVPYLSIIQYILWTFLALTLYRETQFRSAAVFLVMTVATLLLSIADLFTDLQFSIARQSIILSTIPLWFTIFGISQFREGSQVAFLAMLSAYWVLNIGSYILVSILFLDLLWDHALRALGWILAGLMQFTSFSILLLAIFTVHRSSKKV